MILLVCGGRNFNDARYVADILAPLRDRIELLVHGDARGADRLARDWAVANGVHHAAVPALWGSYGKLAGGRRNSAMLLIRPDWFVAFPGGSGTADMVRKLTARNVSGTVL